MSYIHEALRKAQKQRDARDEPYPGVLSARGFKKGVLARRPVLWISVALVITVVGFGLYSWLNSGTRQPPSNNAETPGPSYTVPAANARTKPPPAVEPSSAKAKNLYVKARVFHKQGRLREAKRLYRESLRMDPGHVDALNNLAVVYMRERNYPAALKSLEKAVRLSPQNVDPQYNLACVYALQGDVSRSLAQLKRAVTLSPSVKQWAIQDSDLEALRNHPGFEIIVKR
jgi:tetratricopeptide (TPR) repeat protein